MHPQNILTAYRCLLYDMPWLAARGGGPQGPASKLAGSCWAPMLDGLGRKEGGSAPAWIAQAADRISGAGTAAHGAAHRDGPALLSIFTHMNGEHSGLFLPPDADRGELTMPVSRRQPIPAARWAEAQRSIEAFLLTIRPEEVYLNDLLALLEEQTSLLPAETPGGGDTDLSVYDRLRIRTAVGCCVSEYLLEQGDTDGHCCLLLPNTVKAAELADRLALRSNDFLLDQFGVSLFLAHGRTPCCGNDLMDLPAEKTPYRELFRRVSAAVSAHKMHRCSAAQLLRLNSRKATGQRECRIYGRSDPLEEDLCRWCRCFAEISPKLHDSEVLVVGSGDDLRPDLQLPSLDGMTGLLFTDQAQAEALLAQKADIRRIYVKNKGRIRAGCSTRLYVGDHTFDVRMDALAEESEGICRLGVCRMDVDDLGQAFVRGFEGPEGEPAERRYRYVTLARTAAFSRQMSLFFQLYINDILSGTYGGRTPLAVRIVYSGSDDVFLVGAWTDAIEAANRIQEALSGFTGGALTISGGVGVFGDSYPIRLSAAQTAELEDRAKQEPEKNAISLFDPRAKHTYGWSLFREKVLGEKYAALDTFFRIFQQERGNAFLYRLLELLRSAEGSGHSIDLARYAYQLARLEPKRSDPRWQDYRDFADRMYHWAWEPQDREQLITAIYLYAYQNRGGSKR